MAFKISMQAATATPRRRTGLRVAGGIAAAVAIFGLAGYFGGPPLIRSLAASQASEALGRKVTIGAAQVRPFSLAATVGDVTIFEPDGTTPMLTLGSADIDASIASLWRLAPVVDAVHIDRLAVHVVREADGRLSFDDIRDRLEARPKSPDDGKPARFSINNIALTESSLRFDDRMLGETQRIDHLTVTLPFLSNLPHDVNIVTQPTISAHINGSPLAVSGTMLPFADAREAKLNLDLDGLDLVRFMPFAPRLTDAEVKAGKLDTRLVVGFRQQQDQQQIDVSGTATLREADIRKRDGAPLLQAGKLTVDIARLAPADNLIHLRGVTLDGLDLRALRRADGTLDLATAFLPRAATPAKAAAPAASSSASASASASAPAAAAASSSASKSASTSTSTAAPAPLASASAPAASAPLASASASAAAAASAPVARQPAGDAKPWRYTIDRVALKQARVALRDEAAFSGPGTLALGPIDVQVDGLSGDSDKPARLDATLVVADGQTIAHEGALSLRDATLAGTLRANGLRPQTFAAWFPGELRVQLGQSAVDAELNYRMSWAAPAFTLSLDNSRVAMSGVHVALRDPATAPRAAAPSDDAVAKRREQRARQRGDLVGDKLPLLSADKLTLDGLRFDLAAQSLQVAQIGLSNPQFAAVRDQRGELVEASRIWVAQSRAASAKVAQSAGKSAAQSAAPRTNAATAPAKPWQVEVGSVAIEGGKLRLTDYQPAAANGNRPVVHQLRGIDVKTGAVRWPLPATPIALKAKAESGRRGVLSLDGTVQPTQPALQMRVDARQWDLTPFQPYLADRFNAALRAGNATVNGRLSVAVPTGKPLAATFAGTAQLSNVRTVDRLNGEDFIRWRSLGLSGIDFQMDDSKGPLRLALGQIALNDFYARVILNANGRLNLQDVVSGGAQQGQPAPTTSLTQANTAPAPASAPEAASASATVAASPSAPAAGSTKGTAAGPQIRIGGIKIDKGNIHFSDFFVKPNYTANLTGMHGSISKVSTGDPAPADLVLEGRLDDDAPVTISGKLNPLGEQLYLDIAAKAAGVELTRLTPYATKYAGYPITKGKMTVDVAYKIENGHLNASNHLFLDQLTFGDKVDSPTATKLPVLLAVSLLKDRNGVIDVNLPVSGSLSDPEFSIGGVIVRVIVNLLTKAITSPFSLIASAFGGGDELGYVEFAPGSANLTDAGRKKVETLGKALNDRPGLRLEITGRIDPATDAAGARRAWLDEQVAEQKVRELRQSAREQRATDDEDDEQGAKVTVSPQEYPKYLEAVYRRSSIKKPRNLIGMAKSLPTAEMEALLLQNAPVTDGGLRQLAERRALAVKQALEREGKVPEARLFLTAPKLDTEGIKDKGSPNRVDFTIRQ
ncbi:DUF748 domain-containing protein [Cupriavidus sp. DB3]|nr:DUF748 domain-containing protein [Cupriavidus sp. DB3]MCA7083567.1 DUF748 domain-containing protein [Cupriavidus sp. DB3]